jgi:nudix-type nucleoside diphosphatase (YffH/AdpP family)
MGLHRAGRDLTRNPNVVVRDVEVLAHSWHVLRRTTLDYRDRDGTWSTQQRETYDRGNGATVLLFNQSARTVLLTRQFRFPAYVNDHHDGMLLEAVAGLLDNDEADAAIRREAVEESGHEIGELTHIFDVYMSPGSVTEKLHFYAAPYSAHTLTNDGGGVPEEGEDITVVELAFDTAMANIGDTIVDAKTIMLLQWAALNGPFARSPLSQHPGSTDRADKEGTP